MRGVAWVAADKWTNRLLAFAVLLVLARLLDPRDFGTVALANVFVTLLSVVAAMGFGPYLQRARSLKPTTTSTAFWVSVVLALVLYGLLALAAPLLGDLFDAPDIVPMLWVLGAVLPLGAASAVPAALLMRELDMKPVAVQRVSSAVIAGALAVALAFAGAGAWALVALTVATSVIGTIMIFALTRWRPTWQFSWSEAKTLTGFSVSVVGNQLVHQLRDRGDELLIGAILGTEALGFWTVATRFLRTALDLFTSVVLTVSLSSFAKVADDRPRLVGAIRGAVSASALLVVPGLVALAIVTPVLIPFAFGAQWEPAIIPAQIITLAGVVNAIQWVDSNVWYALGRPGTELLLTAIISAVHLGMVAGAALVSQDLFGNALIGVALAVMVRMVALFPLRFLTLRYAAGIPFRIYADLWRIGIAAAAMAAAMWGTSLLLADVRPLTFLLVEMVVGGVVYLGAVFLAASTLTLRLVNDVRGLRRPRTA